MTTMHAPGPWSLMGSQGTSVWSGDKIIASIEGARTNHRQARANAEFIVTACNAHAKLTAENAALHEQLANKDEACNNVINAALSMPDPVRDQLVAALKYARRMMKPDSDFAFVDAALLATPRTAAANAGDLDAPCTTGCQINPTGDPQNDCGNCILDTRRAESDDGDLAKDAARYRWMRSKDNLKACDLVTMLWDDKLDTAVDAAMQGGQPTNGAAGVRL